MSKELNENAPAGVTSSASVATVRGEGLKTNNVLKRKKKIGRYTIYSLSDFLTRVITNSAGKRGGDFSFTFKDDSSSGSDAGGALSENQKIDINSLTATLSSIIASRAKTNDNNVSIFVIQDDENKNYKVYVNKKDAERFEQFLEDNLTKVSGNQTGVKQVDVVEILYNASSMFDIPHIDWPTFEGQEQEEDIEEVPDEQAPEEEIESEEQPDEKSSSDTEDKLISVLNNIIDMLKNDIEARKAEAEAKKMEAKERALEAQAEIEKAVLKREEEVLDMEAYYKKKSEQERKAAELQKLAKYRHEIAQQGEESVTESVSVIDDELEEGWYFVNRETGEIFGPFEEEYEADEGVNDLRSFGVPADKFYVDINSEKVDMKSIFDYLKRGAKSQ